MDEDSPIMCKKNALFVSNASVSHEIDFGTRAKYSQLDQVVLGTDSFCPR